MLEDTSLFKAVTNNAPFEEIKSIIDFGADLKETDNDGLDILTYAVMKNNNPEVIKLLVDKGLSIHQIDNKGRTLAHFAAENPNPQIMQTLIDYNVDFKKVDNDIIIPLMIAAMKGSPEVCELLLKGGSKLTAKDRLGRNSFSFSAMNSNKDVFNFFVEYASKKTSVLKKCKYEIISIAIINNNLEIIENYFPFIKENLIDSDNFYDDLYPIVAGCSDLRIIEFLRENGFDFSRSTSEGNFCSLVLAKNPNPDVIDYLIKNELFINDVDLIFSSIIKNPLIAVWRKILESVIDKHKCDSNGCSLLMRYVKDSPTSNIDIIDLLADETTIKGRRIDGVTPLLLACHYNPDIKLIDYLIAKGADVNARDNNGNDALIWSIGNECFDFIKYFICNNNSSFFNGIVTYSDRLEQSYDYIYNNYGMDGFKISSMEQEEAEDYDLLKNKDNEAYYLLMKKKYLELMKHFVGLGANIHTRNNDGENILMIALKNRVDIDRINYIISLGIDVNECNNQGIPTIFYAAKYNPYLEVFKLLVDKGADLNYKTAKNENIVFYAAANRNPEIIRYLGLKGFDLYSKNVEGAVPLFEAAKNSSLNLVKYLYNSKVVDNEGKNLMHYLGKYYSGVFWSSYPKANLIIDGFDPNCRDNYGNTPILYTAQNPSAYNIKILVHLIQHEGDIKAVNNDGDNVLMMALKAKNNIKTIKFLIYLDSNLFKLRYYLKYGRFDEIMMEIEDCIKESLVKKERIETTYFIDINAKNSQGETALMIAARNYTNLEFVEALLQAGAYVGLTDINGNTAYQIAKEYNPNPAIAELLKV